MAEGFIYPVDELLNEAFNLARMLPKRHRSVSPRYGRKWEIEGEGKKSFAREEEEDEANHLEYMFLIGRKWDVFVNLSTITQIAS